MLSFDLLDGKPFEKIWSSHWLCSKKPETAALVFQVVVFENTV